MVICLNIRLKHNIIGFHWPSNKQLEQRMGKYLIFSSNKIYRKLRINCIKRSAFIWEKKTHQNSYWSFWKIVKHLLYFYHYAESFTSINSFNLPRNPRRLFLLSSFHGWGNWDTETLNNLSKFVQLAIGANI